MAMTLDMALSNGVALNMSSASVSAPSPLMAAKPRKNKTVSSCRRRTRTRAAGVRVSAKYGEKSVYFDLEDMGNTTGNWDLYGSDAPSPYNSLQSKFFETFAAPFTKRGLLLKFLLIGGGGALLYASTAATGDILPIKKGPQLPPVRGPQDKL